MKLEKLLKPNLTKISLLILLFLLTSFFFVLFTHPETVRLKWLLILIPLYVISSLIYQSLSKQRLLLRIVQWIVLTPLGLLFLLCLISQIVPNKPPKDFLITHNFVDLKQIDDISKFRSCAGHQTVPQYTDDPISNMQHYINRPEGVDPGQVKIYAPFDGYVLGNAPFTMADGPTMIPKSGIPWWPFNQWRFSMDGGAHLLPQFQDPAIHQVKAGEVIGYFDPTDRYGNKSIGSHLRVGVTALPPMFKNGNGEPYKKLDSVFSYMSDQVFDEYKKAIPGLTSREDFITPRSYREAHPCRLRGSGPYFDIGKPEDLPIEEQNVYIGTGIKDLDKIIQRTKQVPYSHSVITD